MSTLTVVLIAVTTLMACALLGGGLYEILVVDPYLATRPGIIQPRNGGVSRRRFWIPAHTVFELLLIVVVDRRPGVTPDVRTALLVALISHAVMRVWSLVDFIPKAVAFEKADPATVDEAAAVRWTRRSLLRLPLDLITCAAMLAALCGCRLDGGAPAIEAIEAMAACRRLVYCHLTAASDFEVRDVSKRIRASWHPVGGMLVRRAVSLLDW